MKKLRNNKGFTLIEMMAVMAILVILIMGMGSTMDAGAEIYQEASFEADSGSLAGILNTALGDILRYSYNGEADNWLIKINGEENDEYFKTSDGTYLLPEEVPFVFTNLEYGVMDAYFYTPVYADGTTKGVLQIRNLKNANVVELVNTGAYPDLVISNFVITYTPQGKTTEGGQTLRGGYFNISYDIFSEKHEGFQRHVETVVRLMNQ